MIKLEELKKGDIFTRINGNVNYIVVDVMKNAADYGMELPYGDQPIVKCKIYGSRWISYMKRMCEESLEKA